ncbi:MAG: amino acid ABC transporter permease [Candidatus Babeliaceae bacterium]|nr:amino acid ABC transporter permease [Candidatus Babeliaceae bacterium]
MIDFSPVFERTPELLKATGVSVALAMGALLIGSLLGTLLAILETSGSSGARMLIKIYTTILRGTPMLIQIVFIYYIVSNYLHLSAFLCALIAIGMNSSAYISQIIKAGIRSISIGQLDAAQALGIPRRELLKSVILPQAIRTVLPALGNEAITLIKDTSLASMIGVGELFFVGKTIISQTYDALSIYIVLACMYMLLTISLSYAITILESKLSYHARN